MKHCISCLDKGEGKSGVRQGKESASYKLPTIQVVTGNLSISLEVYFWDVKQAHLYSSTRKATKHIPEPPDVNNSWITPLLDSLSHCFPPLVQIIETNFVPKENIGAGAGEQYKDSVCLARWSSL